MKTRYIANKERRVSLEQISFHALTFFVVGFFIGWILQSYAHPINDIKLDFLQFVGITTISLIVMGIIWYISYKFTKNSFREYYAENSL